MINADIFNGDKGGRARDGVYDRRDVVLADVAPLTAAERAVGVLPDRPLIAQFCATTPQAFADAAAVVAPFVDAVDLNLGCPQKSAQTGGFGAFLMDKPELVRAMIEACVAAVSPTPVTAKIRVFESVDETVAFATMLEAAGVAAIAVHGRSDSSSPSTAT
jgi:tRNA-dihydrouridine synthase